MQLVYKICPALLWREVESAGSFLGAPVDLADGYIHFSSAAQVAETARRHFRGEADLLLVAVDASALGDALRWEPSRGGDLFPHLYGRLPLSAVVSVRALPLRPDGAHDVSAALGDAAVGSPVQFDPASEGWARREDSGFVALVGPLWTRRDGEGDSYGFLAEERHLNRGGVVHGGMLMTFADQSLGMAAWAANGDRPQVTVQLETQFISSVRDGEFVEARCRVLRQTNSLLFMRGDLTVGDRLVAACSGVWKMMVRRDRKTGA